MSTKKQLPSEQLVQMVPEACKEQTDDALAPAEPQEAPKLLLTLQEAADLLGISISHLYTLRRTKHLPTLPLGRSVRVSRSALEHWIAELEQEARWDKGGSLSADRMLTKRQKGGRHGRA